MRQHQATIQTVVHSVFVATALPWSVGSKLRSTSKLVRGRPRHAKHSFSIQLLLLVMSLPGLSRTTNHFDRRDRRWYAIYVSFVVELCCMWKAAAEDPFEIHIYEYEPMRLGEYSLE